MLVLFGFLLLVFLLSNFAVVMEEVLAWLKANDLEDLKEVFASQMINTMKRLRRLTDEMVKEIIPVGARIEFLEALEPLRREKTDEVNGSAKGSADSSSLGLTNATGFIVGADNSVVLNQPILIEVADQADLTDTDSGLYSGELVSSRSVTESEGSRPESPAQPSSSTSEAKPTGGKRKRETSGPRTAPHLEQFKARQKLKSLDLLSLFEQDVRANIVYDLFKEKGCLTESGRSIIVGVIVNQLLKWTSSPEKEEFNILVDKLAEIFPEEKGTSWFCPPTKKGGNPSGKLYNRVRNVKLLSSLKNFKESSRTRPLSTEENTDNSQASTSGLRRVQRFDQPANLQGITNRNDVVIQTAVAALKHRSPDSSWRDLLPFWSDTHALRRSILKGTRPQDRTEEVQSTPEEPHPIAVNGYFQEWPILSAPNADLLLLQDYDELFPSKKVDFGAKWEIYAKHIVDLAKSELPKSDVDSQNLIKSLENIPEGSQDPTILCLLVAIVCKKSRGKGASKLPSVPEARNAFILHVKIPGDLQAAVRHHHAVAKERKQTVQPLVVLVGPNLSTITASYLQIDGVRYKLRTPIAAVDACYKAFHALDAKYPDDCQVLWIFIQQFFYELRLKEDPLITRVETVSSSLRGMRKKYLEEVEHC